MIRPAITEPRPWRFPNPARSSLGSGLGLAFIDLPGQALASVELVLPTPLEAEPRELEGVATVVLHACDEATVTLPDIVERLELQGAALLGRSTWGYTRLGVSAPARRLPKVLELFASVVREPAFDEPDLAHHVETQVAAWKTRMASPTAVTREALRTSLFGPDQREGRPIAGSPETLGAIDQDGSLIFGELSPLVSFPQKYLPSCLSSFSSASVISMARPWLSVFDSAKTRSQPSGQSREFIPFTSSFSRKLCASLSSP